MFHLIFMVFQTYAGITSGHIVCPAGSKLVDKMAMDGALKCCDIQKSEDKECFRNGPWIDFQFGNRKHKFEEIFYVNDKRHGFFIQYYHNLNIKRVTGNYKFDKPVGVWKLYGTDGKPQFEVTYVKGVLSKIKKFDTANGDKEFKIVKSKLRTPEITNPIGVINKALTGVTFHYNSHYGKVLGFEELFLYADEKKSKISGAAIGEFRFTESNLGNSKCDSSDGGEDGFTWDVFKKTDNMCLVKISKQEKCDQKTPGSYWVDCENYKSIVDFYSQDGIVKLDSELALYSKPNGKIVEPKPAEEKNEDWDTDHSWVTITDSKVIKNELWIKIDFTEECGEKPAFEGEYWMKFWNGIEPSLDQFPSC